MEGAISTPLGEMWLDDGVLYHRIDTFLVQPEAAAQIGEAVRMLTEGRQVPAVIDIRQVAFAEKDARRMFVQSPEDSLEIATALIVAPGSSETMAKVFVNIDKPARPVAAFTSEAEAVAWARGFLDPVG